LTPHPKLARAVRREVVGGTLCCALAHTGLTALVAAAVWFAGLSDDARQLLGFGFGGLPGGASTGLEIAAHNAQLAGAALVGAAFAPRSALLALLLDVLLGALLVLNAGFVGIAAGAYGGRLLAAVWPHLPFELAAFSLAGGTYLAARAGRLTGPALGAAAALVAALLLAAGLVEATVSNPR
jgi:hypothetical protein